MVKEPRCCFFVPRRFGRKVAILVLCLVGIVGNLIPLFIAHHWGLAVARLIAGMGAESVCSTVFVLGMEASAPLLNGSGLWRDGSSTGCLLQRQEYYWSMS